MSNVIHKTRALRVWVDVDEGIADLVLVLNDIPGVRTYASCQGTIDEGGAAPYAAHVMVGWADDGARALLGVAAIAFGGRIEELGPNLGYVYP